MLVLLDSTVLIDCMRGRPAGERVRSLRRSGDQPCTTAVNVEEVVRGLRDRERSNVQRLFAGLPILGLDDEHGWVAGDWRRAFARRGTTLTQGDCLVAAAAKVAGAKLVTGNPKDFPMAEIEVEHWPVGE